MCRSRRSTQLAKLSTKFSGRTGNPKDKGEIVIMHRNWYLCKTEHERGYVSVLLASRKGKFGKRGRSKWLFLLPSDFKEALKG